MIVHACGRRGRGRTALLVAAALVPVCPAAAQQPVSFARQVAPLLAARCGGCHVGGRKGDFQMQTYEQLMATRMVQPGAGEASRLVEVIATGDMPRGGGKVSAADLAMLVKWIDAGAACDTDPKLRLDVVARGGAPAAPAAPAAMPAAAPRAKPGDVPFSARVAPVLVEHCVRCHGAGEDEGGLRMHTLQALMRGGGGGAAVVPGKSADSLLVKKLRGAGIDGQRMPLGKPPLAADVIAAIARWIDEGAGLDLLTATDTLETVAAAGRAKHLSDADMAAARRTAAATAWRLAIPDEQATVESRDRLLVLGNLPAARLAALADEAAEVEQRVRAELVAAGPLLKGGLVLFAFRNAYDYSALWQQAVGGERPKALRGHAGSYGDAVYGALLVPATDPDGLDTRLLLAEQIAGAALAGRGVPAWFAQGGGRAVAMRVAPKAPLVQVWRREVPAAVRACGSTADFLGGHAEPGAAALAAGGFVAALAPTPAKLKACVATLDGGAEFAAAFGAAFRGSPDKLFQAWAAKESRRK